MTNHIELTNFIKKNIKIDDDDLKIVLSYFKTIKKRKNDILLVKWKKQSGKLFCKKRLFKTLLYR